ncbi:AIPR family protein [Lichenicola sp.]|uniref:AIPR family protein n=1 Tax=Lichenicola sp. TaxID=2804529 RepID=UPI003B007A12
MMVEEGLITFASELRAEVEEAVLGGEPYSQPEFTRIVLDRLAEEGVIENPTPLDQEGSFGNTKYKITGFSLDEEEGRLVLVTTIYKDQSPPQAIPVDEIRVAADRAVRFFTCSTRGLHEKIEPSLTDASELARKIYELRDRISFIRVLVLSDGLVGSRSLDDLVADKTRITYELYGIERLFRVLGEGVSREDIVVDLMDYATGGVPCLPAPAVDGSYRGYLVALPGAALADAYERYGTRLLELNVRAFLGVSGRKSVNAGLRATLKDEPANFLAFNNGIVATVDRIEIDTTAGMPRIIRLQGMQIVNGGQTTASIHRARRIDGQKLHAVLVPAKIIVVPPDDLSRMVVAISKSANSQNTVQPADFSANDPFHVRVEHLANNVWLSDGTGRWFYERARGTYGAQEARASARAASKKAFAKETPKERRFAKTDLAKYLNAWEGHPDQVSYGNQKNFQLFMQRQRDAKLDVKLLDEEWFRKLVAIGIVFKATVKIVRDGKFPAYQANIIAYTIACLSWQTGGRIDFDRIWQRQAVSPELTAMLKTWSHRIDVLLRDTAGARMPTEAAKRPETWEAICNLAPELHNPLPPELTGQNKSSRGSESGRSAKTETVLTAVDLAKINETRAIHAQTWLEIASWGQKSKAINYTLVGIARSMAELAIGSWEKSPSAKQAKWALEANKAYQQRDC